MSVIPVNKGNNFAILPEGRQVLQIVKVDYKEKFHKVEVQFISKDNCSHTERYMLNTDGGLKVFSYLTHTVLNNWDSDSVDTKALVGKFVSVEVVHNIVESNKNDGTTKTFANLKSYQYAESFDVDSKDNDITDLESILD